MKLYNYYTDELEVVMQRATNENGRGIVGVSRSGCVKTAMRGDRRRLNYLAVQFSSLVSLFYVHTIHYCVRVELCVVESILG